MYISPCFNYNIDNMCYNYNVHGNKHIDYDRKYFQGHFVEKIEIHDFKMNYPAIHETIEDEIENREWFKDVVTSK